MQDQSFNQPVIDDAKLPLTPATYKRKFQALLQIEEEEHSELLANNCDGDYCISDLTQHQRRQFEHLHHNAYFCICGMEPKQILYASQNSSEICIKSPSQRKGQDLKGYIIFSHDHYNSQKEVLFFGTTSYYSNVLHRNFKHGKGIFSIEFKVKHSYFKNLIKSVDLIDLETIQRIIPSERYFRYRRGFGRIPRSLYRVNRLDRFQLRALRTMLFSQSTAPILVPGPFGTGKTRLLSVASEYFITNAKYERQNVRILLCCHHQGSADIFMREYFLKMLRDDLHPWDAEVVRVVSEVHKKSNKGDNYDISIARFKANRLLYCSRPHIVIVTTFMTALQMAENIPRGFFTHILIDEGAQAREPECIAPLCMADNNTRIIIAGDSKQVGPKLVVLGDIPQKHGLGESLLERLHTSYMKMERARRYSVILRNNYRCSSAILRLPSDLFYKSSLIPRARVKSLGRYPLGFICSSISKEDEEAMALCENEIEANILVEEAVKIVLSNQVAPYRICIMSPSKRQINVIRNKIRQNKKNNHMLQGIKLLSTYQMQGQEFDVLLLGTAESVYSDGEPFDPLKSLCHPAVFNTAITRARLLVIAVGNPLTLTNSEQVMGSSFGCWKQFISRCKRSKTYDGISFQKFSQTTTDSSDDGRAHPTQRQPSSGSTQWQSLSGPTQWQPSSGSTQRQPSSDSTQRQPSSDSTQRQPLSGTTQQQPSSGPNQWQSPSGPTQWQPSSGLTQRQPSSGSTQRQPLSGPTQQQPSSGSTQWQPSSGSTQRQPSSGQTQQQPSTQQQPKTTKRSSNINKKSGNIANQRSKEDYDKHYPSLGDSKHISDKAVKAIKWMEEETVREEEFRHTHRTIDKELLKEDLTRENYKEKFHQLLCREEEEHDRILKERCNGQYECHIYQQGWTDPYACRDARGFYNRFGHITNYHLDGDKIAYALQASEGVYIKFQKPSGNIVEVKLDIVGTKFNKIFLGLTAENEKKIVSHGSYYIPIVKATFILKYSYFDRLHSGINDISNEVIEKLLPCAPNDFSAMEHQERLNTFMFPEIKEFVSLDSQDHFEDKNGYKHKSGPQTFALKTILKADPCKAPILIAGSFGTGKTRLLARAAYQILHNDRNTKVLICAHHQKSVDSFVENYFGEMIKNGWKCNMMIRLVPNTSYKKLENNAKYYKTEYQMKMISMDRIKLVLTTYSSAHRLKYLGKNHFTHILLDEGAQSREPEIIIPFCVANKNTTIVIAGDHKQVGPSILVLGQEARENGLKVSLLERLHSLYSKEKLTVASEPHCIALLTNFRSHHALLSLPSYLFYGSALATKAKSTTEHHPDFLHPLKFICSSLDDTIVQVNESDNEDEAILILNEVVDCFDNWPDVEEGSKNPKQVCIMATTANQKNKFVKLISRYNKYKKIKNVSVLTVYDIQGSEFRVIYLSTAEPIDESGKSKNPTKSPCGQFVFNTAITRAKSLVVCAGNPFLLMNVEKTMEKVDVDKSFWKEYIRRCIITRSFRVPSSKQNTPQLIEKIQKLAFNSEVEVADGTTDFGQQRQQDSIIKIFEKIVASRYNYQQCAIKIRQQEKESQNWQIIPQESDQAQSDAIPTDNDTRSVSLEKITCELQIKTHQRGAIAIPQRQQQDAIIVNGYKNRKGAFNGDLVEISVYGKDDNGQRYGRVTNVVEFQHPVKYICIADEKDVIYFHPIDKTVPCIVNLPNMSHRILQHRREEFGEIQRAYISVFEESSLNVKDGQLALKIKELIPFELSSSLLFVVKVLNWSPKYRKPLGAVVEALPQTNSLFINEKLLLIAHDIKKDDVPFTEEDYPVDGFKTAQLEEGLKVYTGALTIDPPDVLNRDDAVRIVPINNETDMHELAVLIIDVAKYIQKDDKLDQIAKSHGTSVYGGQLRQRHHGTSGGAIHMLPSTFTSNMLSLNEGNDLKHVIAVSAKVNIVDGKVIKVKKGVPEKALLKCPVNLSYKTSQCIMNGQSLGGCQMTPHSDPNIKKMLDLLFKVAMKIRIDRLQDAAYNYQITEPDEVDNLQTHLMVEELMIWANSHVANYMIDECSEPPSDFAVLRCQPPPLAKELKNLHDAYKDILGFSLCYKSLLSQSEQDLLSQDTQDNDWDLKIPSQTIADLKLAYANNDLRKIFRILSLESNIPQLAMIEAAKISISQSAKYVFAKNVQKNPEYDALGHFSIQSRYTHFSSPIRRYFDIVVQRILKALLEQDKMPYKASDLEDICRILNLKMKNSKRYSKDIDRVMMASYWEDEGMEKATAYVSCSLQKRQKLYLSFPSGQYKEFMNQDDTSFDYSQLNYHTREQNVITWIVLSVPLGNSDYIIKCPQLAKKNPQSKNTSEVKLNAYPIAKESEQSLESAQENIIGRKNIEHLLCIKDDDAIVKLDTWKLAQNCVKNPNKENIDTFMSELIPLVSSDKTNAEKLPKDVITSITGSPLIRYTVKTRFCEGTVVNAWISKSITKPISSPNLQLLEVAPTVRICLQHIKDPTICFSGKKLELSSRLKYNSESQYVDLWSKALLAEGSHDGVMTKEIILLKDAPLRWPTLVKKEISLDKAYFECKDQTYLTLNICLEKFDMMDLVGIKSGDLICARYEVLDKKGKMTNEVYHLYVKSVSANETEVKNEKELNIVFGSYGEYGCRVSEKMENLLKSNDLTCELQIIKMPISFNRLFKRLQSLKTIDEDHNKSKTKPAEIENYHVKDWMPLAVKVALGNDLKFLQKCPELKKQYDDVYHNSPYATSLWNSTKEKLNEMQLKAIELALEHKFQLIQGPPGTGKSITGAHLAFIFAKSNRKIKKGQCVLYCGPSNKAVDVVHNQLIELNEKVLFRSNDSKLKILRLYGRTHERKDYADPVMEVTKMHHLPNEKMDSVCQEKFKEYALHHKIRKSGSSLTKMEDGIRKKFLQDKEIPSAKKREEYKTLLQECERKEMQNGGYDIILCTCNETCSRRLSGAIENEESKPESPQKKDKAPLICQCIVDECGMATEPETIVAISKCQHAVLIGDHKQLQPVVKHQAAKNSGLSRSLFERYAENDKENILITLEKQYRMHPFICKGPSEIFYDGRLEADECIKSRQPLSNLNSFWLNPIHPIKVYDMEGKEESGMKNQHVHKASVDAHSKFNILEAEKTVSVIKTLIETHSISEKSIAVLTPYSAQKNKIDELLKEEKVHNVSILSVIESQGDEYDVVIISTVRSQPRREIKKREYIQPDQRWRKDNLGFLIDPHQVNVAITRAKHGLIIIGNCTLLRYDETWEKLIEKYEEADCVEVI